eukprot:CAMPEP_0116943988 /NCGR_PEP_ID=MMETSP0467-20121206/35523_1 /TAXON_ID=283647 /ORGANISM="Mesodinium pulex, Strain SPMC105" /LENGTH=44 /DNA_ID= /DNA_START= /DNA_END= /DNA_ORIENTATION=
MGLGLGYPTSQLLMLPVSQINSTLSNVNNELGFYMVKSKSKWEE